MTLSYMCHHIFSHSFPTFFFLLPADAFPPSSSVLLLSLYQWENICHLSFWVWLVLLNMISNCIHFPTDVLIAFSFMTKFYLYMYHLFIHSSADGHAGLFSFIAVVNTAATVDKLVSWCVDLGSLGWMPRSGAPGSYGRSSSSFVRKLL